MQQIIILILIFLTLGCTERENLQIGILSPGKVIGSPVELDPPKSGESELPSTTPGENQGETSEENNNTENPSNEQTVQVRGLLINGQNSFYKNVLTKDFQGNIINSKTDHQGFFFIDIKEDNFPILSFTQDLQSFNSGEDFFVISPFTSLAISDFLKYTPTPDDPPPFVYRIPTEDLKNKLSLTNLQSMDLFHPNEEEIPIYKNEVESLLDYLISENKSLIDLLTGTGGTPSCYYGFSETGECLTSP